MESFSILHTNTGLTTNLKIVVDSKYGLFMESIDSTTELSSSKFKKVRFNKDNYFDEFFSFFYKDTPAETAFTVKYNDDNDNQFIDFSEQYDDIYQMGARNIVDNKNYIEEFEFFAPIYFTKGKFPKYFMIFRADGPGLIDLNKDNFKDEIVNKLKCVKVFDLTRNTQLGEWIDKNFIKNTLFPDTPLEVDFRLDEFTKWHGIDFQTGGYSHKSAFLNDTLEYENPIFDLEKFVSDGYKRNNIVFPNIINFSFLFDDTPATPTSLRKWSLNRYFGFYLKDIDLETTISPYTPPLLKLDIYIDDNNNIESLSSTYPFADSKSEEDFINRTYYVEYLGNFYKVEQYKELQPSSKVKSKSSTKSVTQEEISQVEAYRYRIVSDIKLTGKESLLNTNICLFDVNNYIIRYSDYSPFIIDNFDLADVWLIEIDGKMHNIILDNGKFKINTDYGFDFSIDSYTYYINKSDTKYSTKVSITVDSNTQPKGFKIFKLNFTDIKDFDNAIIDTEYSKYEYEKKDSITETDESKMYFPDLKSGSFPRNYDDYLYKGSVVNIPTSSEYTSGLETFRIVNDDLTDMWRKNPIYCRWGFENSISTNDQQYLLNNSELFEDFNRSVNPFLPVPSRIERNLDYFYTVNSSTSSYIHHSLHVEDHLNGYLNTDFKFELSKYLNTGTYSIGTSSGTYSFDYFSYFFGKKTYFDNGNIIKNTKKYSQFNRGDKDVPNTTLFRNIKFLMYDIDNIKYENGNLTDISLKTSNKFDDYKFSILLNDNREIETIERCFNFNVDYIYPTTCFTAEDIYGATYFATYSVADSFYTTADTSIIVSTGAAFDQSFEGYRIESINGNTSSLHGYGIKSIINISPSHWSFIIVTDTGSTYTPIGPFRKILSLYLRRTDQIEMKVLNSTIYQISSGDLANITAVGFTYTGNHFANTIIADGSNTLVTLADSNSSIISFSTTFSGGICFEHTQLTNDMNWYIVDEWNTKESYDINSIVVFDDMLFQTSTQSLPITQIVDNKIYPWLYSGWSPYIHPSGVTYSLLWNPTYSYSNNDIIFNSGEYYKYNSSGTYSLWNPYITYTQSDIVLYKSEFWTSGTTSNTQRPSPLSSRSNIDITYWSKSSTNYNSNCKWGIIELFNINSTYIVGDYVVYNEIVYKCINSSFIGGTDIKIPTNADNWSRVSSIYPDTEVVYSETNNPVIYLNDKYYISLSNLTNSTLQNGINIYINNKWKNILVDISIDDNTIKNITNTNRDDLYGFNLYQLGLTYSEGLNSPVNTKLTAANIMSCINDISNKYGFTDYLNYIIVNEDGTKSTYNYKNLTGLTNIIKCEYPDKVNIKVDSLIYKEEPSPINLMKSNRFLALGTLDSIDKLNYYNNLIPAYKISKSEEFNTNPMLSTDGSNPPTRVMSNNSHGIKNIIYNNIYRHSGYYMPIFYEVDLFERPGFTSSIYGNYKFDTNLTNFGKIKQRVISKVNRKKSILKLRDRSDYRSIYPMLDEFGYAVVDFFIFKSTWDYSYHVECSENINSSNKTTEDVVISIQSNYIGNDLSNQINNNNSETI